VEIGIDDRGGISKAELIGRRGQSNLVYLDGLSQLFNLHLNPASDTPLYRQLADHLSASIEQGLIPSGRKLPPTRELAGQLGLNRTTVSAAYALLEEAGLIEGQVGRGSFVVQRGEGFERTHFDWETMLPPLEPGLILPKQVQISFANSRPAADAFPMAQFRRLAKEVIEGPDAAEILQLGSPHGYEPLRRYQLERAANEGIARHADDLMITSGCQQGLDLLARILGRMGKPVAMEDPVYHGQLRVFARAGVEIVPVPVDAGGLDVEALERVIRARGPGVLMVTPSFQNPTGATLSLERRKRVVEIAQRSGLVLVENDIYSELRYSGDALPTLKQLDATGNTILLRSYSKVSFPGLRVGWVIAPRPVIARLAELKQLTDLHSDRLSQAVLLRFAESGELEAHLERTRRDGAERLSALLRACQKYLPANAKFTRPAGGMNLWIELPAPLTAEQLLQRAQERGVTFLPGSYFSAQPAHARCLRVSFGGLAPEEITRGIRILGETAKEQLAAMAARVNLEPGVATV
jgi:2-aminoadipate transaminase